VSKAQLGRALLYLQGIFAEAERRGWNIEPSSWSPPGVAIVVCGQSYAVSLNKLHGRLSMSKGASAASTRCRGTRARSHP
jgi:hypothetical protein